MATGSMASGSVMVRVVHFTLITLLVGALHQPASAQEVGLAGVLGTKAMLLLNGGEPQAVRVGEMIDGIKVIAVQSDAVTIEMGGKKRILRVGQYASGAVNPNGGGKVLLKADSQGHFLTLGTVNGKAVRFLVDTGASMISIGASDARRMGIDPSIGKLGVTDTANGESIVSLVKLDTVKVGDITLYGVEALIHPNEMPYALLGMSFLNRMDMQRDGNTMTLIKRF